MGKIDTAKCTECEDLGMIQECRLRGCMGRRLRTEDVCMDDMEKGYTVSLYEYDRDAEILCEGMLSDREWVHRQKTGEYENAYAVVCTGWGFKPACMAFAMEKALDDAGHENAFRRALGDLRLRQEIRLESAQGSMRALDDAAERFAKGMTREQVLYLLDQRENRN